MTWRAHGCPVSVTRLRRGGCAFYHSLTIFLNTRMSTEMGKREPEGDVRRRGPAAAHTVLPAEPTKDSETHTPTSGAEDDAERQEGAVLVSD